MRCTICKIIVLWGQQFQAMLSTLILLREWAASFKVLTEQTRGSARQRPMRDRASLAKACFLKPFSYLGQVQHQVFMCICCVLWKHCSPPLHDWRDLQPLEQLSLNHVNLDHHAFEIIQFFISSIFYRCSVSWYFLWFLVYIWSFTEINFPADISWFFVLSHANFIMIQHFCCSASMEVTWYMVYSLFLIFTRHVSRVKDFAF